MNKFKVISSFEPRGDQPRQLKSLATGSYRARSFKPYWGNWIRKDLYHGEGHREGAKANPSYST